MFYTDKERRALMAARALRRHCIALQMDEEVQDKVRELGPDLRLYNIRLSRYSSPKKTKWGAFVELRGLGYVVILAGVGWTKKAAVLDALAARSGQFQLPMPPDEELPF
jgi:hypothetical protein